MLRSGGDDSKVEIEGVEGKIARTGVEVMFLSVLGVGVLRREAKVLVCVGGGDSSRWCVLAMVRRGVGERVVEADCGRVETVAMLVVAVSRIGACKSGRDSTDMAEPNRSGGEAGWHREGVSPKPVTCRLPCSPLLLRLG